jgi:hypothetical protein
LKGVVGGGFFVEGEIGRAHHEDVGSCLLAHF